MGFLQENEQIHDRNILHGVSKIALINLAQHQPWIK